MFYSSGNQYERMIAFKSQNLRSNDRVKSSKRNSVNSLSRDRNANNSVHKLKQNLKIGNMRHSYESERYTDIRNIK